MENNNLGAVVPLSYVAFVLSIVTFIMFIIGMFVISSRCCSKCSDS